MKYLSSLSKCSVGIWPLFFIDIAYAQKVDIEKYLDIFGEKFVATPTIAGGQSFQIKDRDLFIQLKKIKAPAPESANLYIKDRLMLFRSVFEPKRVDYPGQYSKVIECPEEYKPKYFDMKVVGGEAFFYQGYANKNKVSGACIPDLIAYRHLYGFVYCPSHGHIYEVEHFSLPKSNKLESFVERLSCEIP
jgi:hypothetical protein